MSDTKPKDNRRRQVLEALLTHLTDKYSDLVAAVCSDLSYDLKELQPKPIESFASSGTSSEIQQLRWSHFEERRVTKVTTVGIEVSKRSVEIDEKLVKLLKFFGLSASPVGGTSAETSVEGLSPLHCKG